MSESISKFICGGTPVLRWNAQLVTKSSTEAELFFFLVVFVALIVVVDCGVDLIRITLFSNLMNHFHDSHPCMMSSSHFSSYFFSTYFNYNFFNLALVKYLDILVLGSV